MDKRTIKTRTALSRAYIQCCINNPGVTPTVTQICILADVNKTTFYRNYSDIMDVHYRIIDYIARHVIIDEDPLLMLKNPREQFVKIKAQIDKLERDDLMFLKLFESDIAMATEKLIRQKYKEIYGRADDLTLDFIFGAIERAFIHAFNSTEQTEKLIRFVEAIAPFCDAK